MSQDPTLYSLQKNTIRSEWERKNELAKKFKQVFGSEVGQDVLDDLREFCKVGYDAYTPGAFDQTANNLGMQRVFLHIEARMAGPGQLPTPLRTQEQDDDE